MDDVKQELDTLNVTNRKIFAILARIEETMLDMAQRAATKSDLSALRDDVLTKMDGFAGRLDDMNLRWAAHADHLSGIDRRLDGIDGRLTRIEIRLDKQDDSAS